VVGPAVRQSGALISLADQLLVPFSGEGAGEQPLSWGQIGFWQGMEQFDQSATMGGLFAMPAGSTIEEIADLLSFMMGRHQALRSRLRLRDGQSPLQVCSESGEVPLRIVECGDDDPTEVAEQVKREFGERNFDYENEWPVRMAVITRAGEITHVVTMYLHTAIDAGGLMALLADVAARDPQTGAAPGSVTAVQPLEQARRQATPTALRQSAASLRHLEHVLRTVTPNMFGQPKTDAAPSYRMIRYRSPATALAIGRIAAEHNVNTSSALLAMFAVGLARHTQDGTVWAMLMVSNRFRPGFADSVSPLVQISPYLIDVAGTDLAGAVSRARSSLLHTYKNAYYDPYQQDEVIERVNRERGEEVDFCCFYNDRREERTVAGPLATDEQLLAAVSDASWVDDYQPDMSSRKLFMNVDDPPGAIDFQLSADTRYFDLDDMLTVLRGIESAAVQTVLQPTASTEVAVRVSQQV
jgi:hypothetical protein